MTCTTHHNACNCREAHFRRLEADNARLRRLAQEVEWVAVDVADGHLVDCCLICDRPITIGHAAGCEMAWACGGESHE